MNGNSILNHLGVDLPQLRSAIRLRWRKKGRGVKRAIICALAAVIHSVIFVSPLGDALEGKLREQWFGLRGNRATPRSVSIVRLDIPAYEKVGVSPGDGFPRDVFAKALLKIASAHPRVIIIDFLMQSGSEDNAADRALAEALATTPTLIAQTREQLIDTDAQGNQTLRIAIKNSVPMFAERAKGIVIMEAVISANRLAESIALPSPGSSGEIVFPLLKPLQEYFKESLESPGKVDLINYYGKAGTITNISLADLIGDATPDPALFRDRAVFVGMMTDSRLGIDQLYDVLEIPIERSSMFGVEIQATIAANLLDRSWIRRMNPAVEIVILTLLLFALTFAILSVSFRPSLVVGIGASVLWLGFSYYCFTQHFLWLSGANVCLLIVPGLLVLRPLIIKTTASR